MILVLGNIKAAPGEADRLTNAMDAVMTETAMEDGCIRYLFSRVANDPDHIVISEIWRDQDALDAHFQTPHIGAFNQAIGGAKLLSVSVKSYDVKGERLLMGTE